VDFGDEGRDDYYGWGMPVISDITYTDNESYTFSIPEGTLSVYGTKDYTADTQPWRLFADRLRSVNVAGGVDRIGDYNFYNVKSATFTMGETFDKIGDYAFYSCTNVKEFNFTIDCTEVGTGAFGGIENFVINGYRNTAAETYALSENITFNALGCRHNYLSEVVDPTSTAAGYTHYTCSVCGDEYNGPYIEPILLDSGVCGENITYSFYDTGKLTISGEGDMYNYLTEPAPWSSFAERIKVLQISGSTVKINPFAFYGCTSLAKIRCDDSDYYTVFDGVLYSTDMSVLVLLPKIGGKAYTMPDSVTSFDASALVSGTAAIEFNSNFTLINSIVYDRSGNIICALPSYKDTELLLSFDISLSDFAFILTEYPHTVCADSPAIEFGRYSLGYYFDGTLHKQDVTFKTYDSGTGRTYAEDNGFTLKTYNRGACGDSAEWYYDTQTSTLTLSGSGSMYAYASADEIPWKNYLQQITSVVIGDEITSLSEYAFYNAAGIKSLTLPASLAAAKTDTTWYGCTGIQTLKITCGSGYTDDYGDCYKFTPWYISRKSIGRFELDKNVLYIGNQAFRGCSAIKEITLEKCKEIAADAFLACTKLDKFTLTSKDCVIADYSLFAYKSTTYGMYSSPVMYGYDDSTAKDYCTEFGANFVSVGCGHSRSFTLVSEEKHECCFDNAYHYFCNDCGSEYDMFEHTTDGHYVSGKVHTLESVSIKGADVYIDGKLSAVTNAFGGFVCENVLCGTHTLQLKKEGTAFFTAELTVDKSNVSEELQIPYGDYNADGFINGRDLALAKAENIADKTLFDWGSTAAQNTVIDTKSGDISTPFAKNFRFEAVQGSDYRQYFYASIVNNGEYTPQASGFLYGVEMDEDDLVLEKAGSENENGKTVRISESVEFGAETKILAYGIKSKKSWFGVRFYVVYSNGVNTHTYYSDVYKYSYE
ncbi:MAG: hypothetical protein E7571_08860, partial [Ruminococcaceae bacterium]|nr:hypothetical protein [Oscillospiraceae bacterium]